MVIVVPTGRIDMTTAEALEHHLLRLEREGEYRLIIDLAGVDYLSSAGLRVLLSLAKRIRAAGGGLAMCALAPPVRQVFELSGLIQVLAVVPSRDEALDRVATV